MYPPPEEEALPVKEPRFEDESVGDRLFLILSNPKPSPGLGNPPPPPAPPPPACVIDETEDEDDELDPRNTSAISLLIASLASSRCDDGPDIPDTEEDVVVDEVV